MNWKAPLSSAFLALFSISALTGCPKDDKAGDGPASSASATPSAVATVTPSATASATASSTATAAPADSSGVSSSPPRECPKGSTGEGTFAKPCEAKGGKERMMTAEWTGKTDDKGPHFRVTNKSSMTILYGKIAVYFYDKAGKQLDTQDTSQTPPKAVPFRTCAGNIFSGVMKPAEKAVITFSCVKKEHVPEGTAAIEAEMQVVGFADSTEKKSDTYWKNTDLTPDARKKGGVK